MVSEEGYITPLMTTNNTIKKLLSLFGALTPLVLIIALAAMPVNREPSIPPVPGFPEFAAVVGGIESKNNYTAVHGPYWGRYQMGALARTQVGISVGKTKFLSDTALQDTAFLQYLTWNRTVLADVIKKHVGTVVKGITVTESGILAMAHGCGHANVRKFFRTGGTYVPNNGRRGTDYLQIGGYTLFQEENQKNIDSHGEDGED